MEELHQPAFYIAKGEMAIIWENNGSKDSISWSNLTEEQKEEAEAQIVTALIRIAFNDIGNNQENLVHWRISELNERYEQENQGQSPDNQKGEVKRMGAEVFGVKDEFYFDGAIQKAVNALGELEDAINTLYKRAEYLYLRSAQLPIVTLEYPTLIGNIRFVTEVSEGTAESELIEICKEMQSDLVSILGPDTLPESWDSVPDEEDEDEEEDEDKDEEEDEDEEDEEEK